MKQLSNSNKVKETIEATTALVEAIPIYQDLVQPAAQEVGKGLHTISKTIHIALAPISAMVWGYDQIKEYVQNTLEKKLEKVPPENIVVPDITIAGPTLEALRFTGQKEELREMFLDLLATSMNSETADKAHPAYIEIIKQLTSDEAKILKNLEGDAFPLLSVSYKVENGLSAAPIFKDFSDIAEKSGCEYPLKVFAYLDNLKRLGIISFHDNLKLSNYELYKELEDHELIKHHVKVASVFGEPVIINSLAQITVFGKIFRSICIQN